MKEQHSILQAVLCLSLAASAMGRAQGASVTFQPSDNGAALENPGVGWVFHHYDNSIYGYGPALGRSYDGRGFAGLTVAYFRLAWSHLKPQEGRFNWSILDTPIQRHNLRGVQLWVSGGGEPTQSEVEQKARVAAEAERVRPIAKVGAKLDCPVAL